MSDPKRLLDELGELDPDTRRALEAARDVEPSRAARGAVWAALLGQIPPGGGIPGFPTAGGTAAGGAGGGTAGGGAASAGAGTLGALGLAKSVGFGAGAGLVVLFTGQAVLGPSNIERAPAASATVQFVPAPLVASAAPPKLGMASAAPAEDVPEPQATAEVLRGTAGASAGHRGAVRKEAHLVALARQRLLSGDPDGALSLLEQVRVRYPGGVLVQEREALAIEALARSGQRDAATARAREFQRAHPHSPLNSRVRDVTR